MVETARAAALDRALSGALGRWRRPMARHDPGKVITDLAVTLALGGDCLADVALLRAEPGAVGGMASDPTVSRICAEPGDTHDIMHIALLDRRHRRVGVMVTLPPETRDLHRHRGRRGHRHPALSVNRRAPEGEQCEIHAVLADSRTFSATAAAGSRSPPASPRPRP